MWALLFASDFTAIPVDSGSADYYDSSVANGGYSEPLFLIVFIVISDVPL